jgi:hypothetical protein
MKFIQRLLLLKQSALLPGEKRATSNKGPARLTWGNTTKKFFLTYKLNENNVASILRIAPFDQSTVRYSVFP